jgi:hypothetical protein
MSFMEAFSYITCFFAGFFVAMTIVADLTENRRTAMPFAIVAGCMLFGAVVTGILR